MRGTGEAIMNMFMINEARKPPRIGSLAITSGILLCVTATAGPALSADYPEYERYRPRYEYYYPRYHDRDYDRGCYRCSCCGGRRYAPVVERPIVDRIPVPIEERPVVERVPVAERHWVQRDYIERRYPAGAGVRYSYPERYRYSYYYPAPREDDPYDRSAGEPPTAPVTYEYDAPRPRYVEVPRSYEFRPAYEYEPTPPPRNAYEYETAPRPPATVPSGYYYNPGYAE
jgi:hypothetical protein